MIRILVTLVLGYASTFLVPGQFPEGPRADGKESRRLEWALMSMFDPYELPARRRDLRDAVAADLKWRLA